MATKTYTTSVVVQFSSGADSTDIFTVEVDDRVGGENSGNTNFVPGVDDPALLLFKSPGVLVTGEDTSAGTITQAFAGSKDIEEFIEFNNEREVTLSYPVSSGFTYKWIGYDRGVVTNTSNTVSIPTAAVGVIKVTYSSVFTGYRLNNIPATLNSESEFPVIVFFSGESP